MNSLAQDIRYALRMLGKNPGFTAVALLVLALGLGANGAMFSVVYHVMLRPLPYREPDQLVRVVNRWRTGGMGENVIPEQANAVAQARSFESVAMTFPTTGCNLVGGSSPQYLYSATVSTSFFQTLGVRPAIGRDFATQDATHGGGTVAIISYPVWRRYFSGDPGVIGHEVQCNGQALTVVGVLPAKFRWSGNAQIWLVDRIADHLNENGTNYDLIVRLRQGVTPEQARQELSSIYAALKRERPGMWLYRNTQGMDLVSYRELQNSEMRQPLLILFAAVGLVLLIACANIAGLLMARSAARAHELAIRMAVGATRGRIAAQLLTETLLLNLIGGAIGLALAYWAVAGLRVILPEHAAWFSSERLDAATLSISVPVMLFMLGASLVSGIITGSLPAIGAGQRDPQSNLKQGEQGGGFSRAQQRGRKALVAAEVALSLALLISATLLIHSFVLLQRVNLGFNPHDLQVVQLSLASKKYSTAQATWDFQRKSVEQIRQIPGLVDAASASSAPLVAGLNLGAFNLHGAQCPGGALDYRVVSPTFFSTIGTPVLRGRAFSDSDIATSAHVVVINESLARACWHDEDPIGQSVHLYTSGTDGDPAVVVGVVGDIRDGSFALDNTPLVGIPTPPIAYVPQAQISNNLNQAFYQSFGLFSAILVRTAQPMDLTRDVTRAIQSVDPQQPVVSVAPISDLVSGWVALPRLLMVLMGAFAGLAVLLTAVGLYGLLSYYVTQRRREIGIRMALGAATTDILRMMLREGMLLVAMGSVIGLAGGLAAMSLLKALLFNIKPGDPLAVAAAVLLLLLVGLAATALPAGRAAQVDPMLALRQE
ncbi:MAG TPA: ABC transporter permease [Terriglobales bacterium]|nr:ABC transporter permease [Terriglobales bacterium]